jgi:hypothetical protein
LVNRRRSETPIVVNCLENLLRQSRVKASPTDFAQELRTRRVARLPIRGRRQAADHGVGWRAAGRVSAFRSGFWRRPDPFGLQHVVARALDANAIAGVAQAAQLVESDVAQVWNSQTRGGEAEYLTQWLADDMAHRGRSPRDYALLVRQKSDDYEAELSEPLAQAGLRLRNESMTCGERLSFNILLAMSSTA